MRDDHELFEAWAGGDRAAGAELFDRHYEALARFFRNKVDDGASADLAQNTFLACLEARARFRGDARFRTFLFAIAHNLLRAHYERRRREPGPLDFDEASVEQLAPSSSTLLRAREEQRLLLDGLRRIPLDCQETLELHYWEKMTTVDIAAVMNVPEGTVKSRLHRGRRLLEQRITEQASSGELLRSTLDNLDRWAGDLRARLLPGASHDDEPPAGERPGKA